MAIKSTKATRAIKAAARKLAMSKPKPIDLSIKYLPYLVWAEPIGYPALSTFVTQDELRSGKYQPQIMAGWVGVGVASDIDESLALRLAANPGIRCAGPYTLIRYPVKL